jgi:pilus assembly protein Flp/PilA
MRYLICYAQSVIASLHEETDGQDLIEYALVAALIALAAVAGMNFVAEQINSGFSLVGNKLINSI